MVFSTVLSTADPGEAQSAVETNAQETWKRYWVGFNRVAGIGGARLRALLNAFGELKSAWNASSDDLRMAGLGPQTIQSLLEARATLDLQGELDRITGLGFRILTWNDEDYPPGLRDIDSSPPVLYLWGGLRDQDRWAVAVVGTRRPTAYGLAVARDLATTLAASGVTVVSGLARGIDATSHKAALDAGGRTIAVLGSGLDRIYPPEYRALADSIAGQGAVVSDFPLGTAPEARNFPPRNRIITGLAVALVVVEAGEGSGALISADFAAEQGRDVFAVPGSIHSRASRGANRLIRSGARPILSPDDLLEALNMHVVARQEEAAQELPEDEVERSVLEALGGDPVHVDDLGLRCNLPPAQISASLAMLELKGRARQVGGMHYVRVRELGAGYRVE